MTDPNAPIKAQPAKPGFKTSEFFTWLATAVGGLATAAEGWLPPQYAAILIAIATAAYGYARGQAKS